MLKGASQLSNRKTKYFDLAHNEKFPKNPVSKPPPPYHMVHMTYGQIKI